MKIREEAVATVKLGAPLIAAQVAQISIGFVDAVMAGRLSPQALAAVAVGSSVWFTVIVLCIGLLVSVSPSVAQLFGSGKHGEIGYCVRQGLWLSLAAAVACLLLLRATEPVLDWLHVAPELIPTSIGFLHAISWGLPAFCAYQVLRSFSEGVSITRPVMYASLIALFGNIAGDYIFMYGKLGLPTLGAVGCGVSSAITMWIMVLFMAAYINLKPVYRAYAVFSRFEWPRWKEISALARLGVPIAVSLFMEASLFGVAALVIGSIGTIAVAGHQIALNVAALTWTVPLGISMAITVRVGQAIGRGDPHGARFAGFVGIALGAAFMSISALVMFTAPQVIASIYTQNTEVREMAVRLLFMAAIFQVFDGLQVSGAGALRGLKDTKIPMFITTFSYWVIGMPLGYLLGIKLGHGPAGLWIGFIFALAFAAILLNVRFHLVTSAKRRFPI
ncbi:MAG TPA: MATE family efflux transporter [Terriglobia bacterium]|nr:MATE family efflux transporter [Terriglobia bacterium]